VSTPVRRAARLIGEHQKRVADMVLRPPGRSDEDSTLVPEKSARDWGVALLLFVLSVLYLWPFRSASELFRDEGILLQGAARILRGEVLYRDFFSFYTPGSYYWLAVLFKLFGTSYLVARTRLAVYGGLFSLLTYFFARRVCGRWTAILAAYLFLIIGLPYRFEVLHNWDSMLTAYLALYCAVWWIQSARGPWAFATGTFAALTFLIEQSKGVGLFIGLAAGLLVVFAKRARPMAFRRSHLAMAVAGLVWPLVPTVAYFAAQHSVTPMISDWLWPVSHYSGANRLPYGFINTSQSGWEVLYGSGSWARRLVFILFTSPCFLLPALPFLALALLAVHAVRMPSGDAHANASSYYTLVCAGGVGLVLSAVMTGRADLHHLVFVAPPLFVPLAWVVEGRGFSLPGLAKWRAALVAYLLVFFTTFGMAFLVGGPLAAQFRLETRRGTLTLRRTDFVIPYLIRHVSPGEEIFVYPHQPLFCFLTATYNPTSFEYLQLGMHSEGQIGEAMAQLAAHPPRMVVWAPSFNTATIPQEWPATPQRVLSRDTIRDFILARYRPCTTLASDKVRYVILIRNGLACPH